MQGGGSPSAPFWDIYKLYNIHDLKLDGIYWKVVPRQIPTALALFFVVAFGSSLDVAAIQQDSPEPLDYNSELVTVGKVPTQEWNQVSGCWLFRSWLPWSSFHVATAIGAFD